MPQVLTVKVFDSNLPEKMKNGRGKSWLGTIALLRFNTFLEFTSRDYYAKSYVHSSTGILREKRKPGRAEK